MSTSSIFYDYIENVEPVCVTAQEFLRTIFAEGELQKKGIQGDGKYNAMIQIGKDKFIYLHDELDSIPDYENVYSAKMNYIAYAGESGEDALARELHAFAIRVIFPERMVWQELKDLFDRHIRKGQPKIRPTFVVYEGDNLIFVYVLSEPIPMYEKFLKKLTALNNTLSREIHTAFEAACFSSCRKPRQGGLYARHAVVGTIADDDLCCAFRTGDLYTLDEINALVPKAQRLDYHKSKVSLEEAKNLWPGWYHYRVEQKREPSGKRTWSLKPEAYSWFLSTAKEKPDEIKPGVLQALASYAAKAHISRYRLVDDMLELSSILESRLPVGAVERHQYTAMDLFDDELNKLKHWSLAYIEKLSGLTLPRNKRNFRTRKEHLTLLHDAQSKEQDVKRWQREHPDGSRADCVRDLGICWNTANRWWSKRKTAPKAKPAGTARKVFDCGCPAPDIVKSTRRWYWEERGNFYKRVVYECKNCGCVHYGKARIDNSQV